MDLIWTVPDTRTDGTSLAQWEISHSEVQRNGEPYTSTTEFHAEAIRNGVYRVRCCDDDNCSDWSNEVRVRMRGKKK